MEEKFNESTSQRPGGKRPLDALMVTIDLPAYMEQLKQEMPWKNGDRNAITVFKTNDMRIVLVALHEGAEIIKHTAEGIISVQVLEGQMWFRTDRQSVELGKGQMIALHERIPHSVRAIKETIFLLTLNTGPVRENA